MGRSDEIEIKYATYIAITMVTLGFFAFIIIVFGEYLTKLQTGVIAGYEFTIPGIAWVFLPIVIVLYLLYKLKSK